MRTLLCSERNWTLCSRNLHVWSLWNSVPVLQQPNGAHAVPCWWVSPENENIFSCELIQVWTVFFTFFSLHHHLGNRLMQRAHFYKLHIEFVSIMCFFYICKLSKHLYFSLVHRCAWNLCLSNSIKTPELNCSSFICSSSRSHFCLTGFPLSSKTLSNISSQKIILSLQTSMMFSSVEHRRYIVIMFRLSNIMKVNGPKNAQAFQTDLLKCIPFIYSQIKTLISFTHHMAHKVCCRHIWCSFCTHALIGCA